MIDVLEHKVKFANSYLNNLLHTTGKVNCLDVYSVFTRDMRESGRLDYIGNDKLPLLDRNQVVEFIKVKGAA